jgi:hypothetical protein
VSTTPVIKAVPTLWLEEAMLRENMGVGGYDVHALSYRGPTGVGVIRPLGTVEVENVPTGQMMPPEPMFTLTHKAAQVLFDALYKQGLRPSSGEATQSHEAALAATRAHLNDMRAIAMKHVGLDLSADEQIQINTLALEKAHEKATW